MEEDRDIFLQGLNAAVDDFEDNISPFFEGYKTDFVDGYKVGLQVIRRIKGIIASQDRAL